MNETFAAALMLSNLFFGAASIVILPWGIRAAKTPTTKVAIGLLYTGIIAMCYFVARAGTAADERGIGSDQVEPFFGTEWYFLLALTVTAVVFQVLLVRKKRRAKASS